MGGKVIVYELFGAMIIVAVLIKVFEGRIPMPVYKAGILIYVGAPFVALADAIRVGWGTWIGFREIGLFFAFALLTGSGTGTGYHRLLTHRSFETRAGIRAVLIGLGAM